MPIQITSQTPAQGATNHPPADFYELIFNSSLGINPQWALVRITFDGTLVFDWGFIGGLTLAPGWEGEAENNGLTFEARFRPVGGWAVGGNYGAGGGALIGQIEIVQVASEDTPFNEGPPDFDFSTAAPEVMPDLPVPDGHRYDSSSASCYVVASGTPTRRNWVASVVRTGPGVYVITLAPGRDPGPPAHATVQPVGPFARTTTLTRNPDGTWTVRCFNAAGAPADANFALTWRSL